MLHQAPYALAETALPFAPYEEARNALVDHQATVRREVVESGLDRDHWVDLFTQALGNTADLGWELRGQNGANPSASTPYGEPYVVDELTAVRLRGVAFNSSAGAGIYNTSVLGQDSPSQSSAGALGILGIGIGFLTGAFLPGQPAALVGQPFYNRTLPDTKPSVGWISTTLPTLSSANATHDQHITRSDSTWITQTFTKPSAAVDALKSALRLSFGRVCGEMSAHEKQVASRSLSEAVNLIGSLGDVRSPWASFSDEGLVIAQWKSAAGGLVLIFAGDGSVTISESSGSSSYLSAPREQDLAAVEIDALKAAISRYSARTT